MKKTVLFSAMGMLSAWGTVAGAEEIGRVISSTPVFQQVAVPRQVCNNQPVAVQQPSSGGGALLGAIVGGVLGNQIGHGMGRAAATGLGVVAGAGVGNSIEAQGYQPQYAQQCTTQTFYENRTIGYNVVYEYAGKEFSVQTPFDPGPTIRLQLTPVGTHTTEPAEAAASTGNPQPPGTAVGVILGHSAMAPAYPAVYPAYPAYPAYYYPRPYFYPPIGLSLGFNFSNHRHGHGHRHRHR